MPANALRHYQEHMPGTLHKNGYTFEEIKLYVYCVQKAIELEGNWWGMWYRDYVKHKQGWNYKNPEPIEVVIVQEQIDAWIALTKAVVRREAIQDAKSTASWSDEDCVETGGGCEWNWRYTIKSTMQRQVAREFLAWVRSVA